LILSSADQEDEHATTWGQERQANPSVREDQVVREEARSQHRHGQTDCGRDREQTAERSRRDEEQRPDAEVGAQLVAQIIITQVDVAQIGVTSIGSEEVAASPRVRRPHEFEGPRGQRFATVPVPPECALESIHHAPSAYLSLLELDAAGWKGPWHVRLRVGATRACIGAALMALRFRVLATALVAAGVLGFVLPAPLFGVFEVTPALNVVHLATGVAAGTAATRGVGAMRACGRWVGAIFALLAAVAAATDAPTVANLLPLSNSNAWFHLAMALVFLYQALLAPPS
jgi:hypothetical protein